MKSNKDRKILWRNVDPSRKIIYRENMPLSVPFSTLNQEQEPINQLLDRRGNISDTVQRTRRTKLEHLLKKAR